MVLAVARRAAECRAAHGRQRGGGWKRASDQFPLETFATRRERRLERHACACLHVRRHSGGYRGSPRPRRPPRVERSGKGFVAIRVARRDASPDDAKRAIERAWIRTVAGIRIVVVTVPRKFFEGSVERASRGAGGGFRVESRERGRVGTFGEGGDERRLPLGDGGEGVEDGGEVDGLIVVVVPFGPSSGSALEGARDVALDGLDVFGEDGFDGAPSRAHVRGSLEIVREPEARAEGERRALVLVGVDAGPDGGGGGGVGAERVGEVAAETLGEWAAAPLRAGQDRGGERPVRAAGTGDGRLAREGEVGGERAPVLAAREVHLATLQRPDEARGAVVARRQARVERGDRVHLVGIADEIQPERRQTRAKRVRARATRLERAVRGRRETHEVVHGRDHRAGGTDRPARPPPSRPRGCRLKCAETRNGPTREALWSVMLARGTRQFFTAAR